MMSWTFEHAGKETTCLHCKGTGKVVHECRQGDLEFLEELYSHRGAGNYEILSIYRCQVCGQLWKVRWQWDAGTGHDDIWLRPGDEKRGYRFDLEEAIKFEKTKSKNVMTRAIGGYMPAFEVPKLLAELEVTLDPTTYARVLEIIQKHLHYRAPVSFSSECS